MLSCSRQKKVIWIDGGTHAREWISVATPMWILREVKTLLSYSKNETYTQNLAPLYPVPEPITTLYRPLSAFYKPLN